AVAAPTCSALPPPGADLAGASVQQLTLAPGRIWSTTTGAGVTVAVVDTGVDTANPQLAPAVSGGVDLIAGPPDGTLDCAAHGTAAASVIAARATGGTRFAGLAPGARILPVRLTEQAGGEAGAGVDPALLAAAIRRATDAGAGIVNVSVLAAAGTPELAAAVRHAQDH
ncbi:S8 family serine peptidase, partial [Frankia sp. AiPs1]|uniref:S8 family serine peptidase n=1 Tax=Frankia sp. AiPs1 TaxID=573493 RepID=UPI002044C4C2